MASYRADAVAWRAGAVVHADDPLAPRQVLDRVSGVGPFPVQHSGDLQGGRVEQGILRAVVPVDENLPITWTTGEGGGDLARVHLVDALQRGAAGVQDAVAVAGLEHFAASFASR